MSLDKEVIQPMLEATLKTLAETLGEPVVRQIKPILLINLARGRVETFIQGDPDRIPAYVHCVVENFSALHVYLHQLQTEQSSTAWEPLYKRMQTWAYNFFLRKNFYADEHTREIAAECATEAAITLLHAHFPYDTEFDPWAHTLVLHSCRKYIHQAMKKSSIPESQVIELDERLENRDEPLLDLRALAQEQQEELEKALAQLTEGRRTVIQLLFLEGLSPQEVAQKMEKTVGAVYTLQFHALADLRKILSTNRDTLNE